MSPIDRGSQDPDGTAAEARAALKANTELGLAPPESPDQTVPPTTPRTFGEGEGFRDDPETPPETSPDDAAAPAKP